MRDAAAAAFFMSGLTVSGLRYKIYGNAEQEKDRGLYYMGDTLKKCLAAGAAALAAWALLIRPRTKYSPDLSALAAYDFANGGLHDFYKGIPKNSLPAVKAAMDGGYAVKLDVRVSRDGVPVILSDHELYGLCGVDGETEDKALAELKKFKLQETDETVCTLEEMLAEINCRVPVILELMVRSAEGLPMFWRSMTEYTPWNRLITELSDGSKNMSRMF